MEVKIMDMKGVVTQVNEGHKNDQTGNIFYGVKVIDENTGVEDWYNGEGKIPIKVNEGDLVKCKYYLKKGKYKTIEEGTLEVIETGVKPKGKKGTDKNDSETTTRIKKLGALKAASEVYAAILPLTVRDKAEKVDLTGVTREILIIAKEFEKYLSGE